MNNGNDLAFPVLDRTQTPNDTTQLGLTKREYFAALALQAMLTTDNYNGAKWGAIADDAVRAADALVAALKELS